MFSLNFFTFTLSATMHRVSVSERLKEHLASKIV